MEGTGKHSFDISTSVLSSMKWILSRGSAFTFGQLLKCVCSHERRTTISVFWNLVLSVVKQTVNSLSETYFPFLIHRLNLFSVQERLQMRGSRGKISEYMC